MFFEFRGSELELGSQHLSFEKSWNLHSSYEFPLSSSLLWQEAGLCFIWTFSFWIHSLGNLKSSNAKITFFSFIQENFKLCIDFRLRSLEVKLRLSSPISWKQPFGILLHKYLFIKWGIWWGISHDMFSVFLLSDVHFQESTYHS